MGELTGQGVRPRTPAVGAAEAAGPTVTAEGHREGHHGVHARWTAGEADGGKVQLTVGAHRLRDGRQGSRQHPHLQARSQGGQRGRSRYLPGVEPHRPVPRPPLVPSCPHAPTDGKPPDHPPLGSALAAHHAGTVASTDAGGDGDADRTSLFLRSQGGVDGPAQWAEWAPGCPHPAHAQQEPQQQPLGQGQPETLTLSAYPLLHGLWGCKGPNISHSGRDDPPFIHLPKGAE